MPTALGEARRRVVDMDHAVRQLGVRVPVDAWPAWHAASYTGGTWNVLG
ncbi:hypothetical protein OHA25_09920 [Nonomuraea sp. NBC_00507]